MKFSSVSNKTNILVAGKERERRKIELEAWKNRLKRPKL